VSIPDNHTHRLTSLRPNLHTDYPGWTFYRATSERWLAVCGNTCLRAQNATELRDRVHHMAEIAEDINGDRI
jgi:hypothetical protein